MRAAIARGIRSVAFFTTLAEALASPHGEIWQAHTGNTASLPRER
jgi:hypothetical protein